MTAGSLATIMVVDDNEPSRDALSRRLERRGYRILTAVDGQQAVATGQATPSLHTPPRPLIRKGDLDGKGRFSIDDEVRPAGTVRLMDVAG